MKQFEILAKYDASVNNSLLPLSRFLGLLYLGFAAAHIALLPPEFATVMSGLAAASAVVLLSFGVIKRRSGWSDRWAHPAGYLILLIALANVLIHVYLMQDELQSTYVALLIVGSGYLLLRTPWFALAVLTTFVAWAGVSVATGLTETLVHFSFVNLGASTLALIIHTVRRNMIAHIERLLALERTRVEELTSVVAKLETSEHMFREVVDSMMDAILVFDVDGRIRIFNAAATRLFGYASEELNGMSVSKILPENLWSARNRLPNELSTTTSEAEFTRLETGLTRKNGGTFHAAVALSSVRIGQDKIRVALVSDMTDKKAALDAVLKAKEASERANRAKSEFLANMSHELRTPLNAIIGYSDMLTEEVNDMTPEDIRTDVERIRHAGKHLLRLINDILDIAKVESGKEELWIRTFSVEQMAEEVVNTIRPLAERAHNVLYVGVGPGVTVMTSDERKIRQCLLNLLSNAAKFTENGQISLSISQQVRGGEPHYAFSVTDTGRGLDEDDLERIFEPFVQADQSSTKRVEGTGLGLALTQRYSHMLGGELTVTSVPGSGSTFELVLPVQLAEVENKTEMSLSGGRVD